MPLLSTQGSHRMNKLSTSPSRVRMDLTLAELTLAAETLQAAGHDDLACRFRMSLHGYGLGGNRALQGGWTVWGYAPDDGAPEGVGAAVTREDDLDLIRPGTRIIARNVSDIEAADLIRASRANANAA